MITKSIKDTANSCYKPTQVKIWRY